MRKYIKFFVAALLIAAAATTCKKKEVDVTDIQFPQGTSISMKVGERLTLSPTVHPSDATHKSVTLSSGDPSVVRVTGMQLEALKVCSTTITATAGKKSVQITVSVEAEGAANPNPTLPSNLEIKNL